MKIIIIAMLFICACLTVQAQMNLVLNGSFEQHDSCPNGFDQIRYAHYWDAIDTNYSLDSIPFALGNFLAEYINTCSHDLTSRAPVNACFHHYPRTGSAMASSVMFDTYFYPIDDYNYIQGRLISHLVAGQSYCVTFYVCQEIISEYDINKIGAYLDDGTIDTTHRPGIQQSQYTPQVLYPNVISDTTNWTKIQGSFIADGSEKFITIGVFFDTAHVTHVDHPSTSSYFSDYLVDDVSVIASNSKAYAGRDTTINLGDSVRLGPALNGDGMPCYWYKLGITTAIDSGGNTWVKPAATTSYVVKMDLCGTVTYDTVKVNVGHVGVNDGSMTQWLNGSMYPNPATSSVTIDGALGCEVGIYNPVGQLVYAGMATKKEEVINVEQLPHGSYYVVVTDMVTGYRVVRQVVKE